MRITSEGPTKITRATIEAAWKRRQSNARLIIRDKDCRGLALIVNATTMVWSYAYRPRGTDPRTGRRWPNRTVTLGNPASLSPDDARNEANRAKGQAATGGDPAAEKKARAAEERRKRAATLSILLDDYVKALPKRPKVRGAGLPSPAYVSVELAQVRMALNAIEAADMPAAALGAVTIRKLVDAQEAGANTRARFGALSRFLDWCQDAGHIQVNPCTLVPKTRRPKAPRARSEYLEPAAMARLWNAADRLSQPVWRDFVRFLIALPCRRGEAAGLDWSHLDLSRAEWRQPDHLTKNRDPHRLHLHPLVMEVLRSRWRACVEAQTHGDLSVAEQLMAKGQPRSGLVFPAPRSGKEVNTFTDIKAALTKATEGDDGEALTGWTWHDFRRSFASALGEAGIPEAVADAILNHRQAATRGGVLGVYQRSSRWPEQVRAMKLWGHLLSDVIDGKNSDEKVAPVLRSG